MAKKCEFSETCPLFYKQSYTCMNSGGSYCGKYRSLVNDKKPTKINKFMPIIKITNFHIFRR